MQSARPRRGLMTGELELWQGWSRGLTVPGEASSRREVLARHKQDVAPAWFRPRSTDCNRRSPASSATKEPAAQQGLTAAIFSDLPSDLHSAGRPKHQRGVFATLFSRHVKDHRCESEDVNRAAVSSDGWIFVSYY